MFCSYISLQTELPDEGIIGLNEVPDFYKMLRFVFAEEILDINYQWLMRQNECVVVVRSTG